MSKRNYETANGANYDILKANARKNRLSPTLAEAALWSELRDSQLGVKFRFQHIIGDFIVDFVSLPVKLVVEVDGGYHFTAKQMALDKEREDCLKAKGYTVLRFTNEEVLGDMENVVGRIKESLTPRPLHPLR